MKMYMWKRKIKVKKLLILGASELQLAAIIEAKNMGIYTIVADYNDRAVGIPFADKFYNVSTLDYNARCV